MFILGNLWRRKRVKQLLSDECEIFTSRYWIDRSRETRSGSDFTVNDLGSDDSDLSALMHRRRRTMITANEKSDRICVNYETDSIIPKTRIVIWEKKDNQRSGAISRIMINPNVR